MARLDATTLGHRAVRFGLISPEQMEQGFDDAGGRNVEPMDYLRALERRGLITPWQSDKLLKGDEAGFFLGGYRILYKIASGSFGRVYRADDPNTGVVVAIKVLRQRWTEQQRNIELFEREGKVGMSMQHPNIVEILSVNCDHQSNKYYIVMEFVEGGNLREILKIRKKLQPPETLRILEDAAAGLAHAYSLGISHRDMKLTNVLIASQGTAKLVDFGLARLSQQSLKDDRLQVDRTVEYAGLEKATNAPAGDIRSDIYFLGCVAYELLTGRPPLAKSKNQYERMRAARFRKVRPMTSEDVDAPLSVFRLVEKMMALDPAERYQTPSQLLDAVRKVRKELEGGGEGEKTVAVHTVFIVEKDPRLQDGLRDRFKRYGYRVLLSGDPMRALDRYKQQPYDALVVDAGSVGEDGVFVFERILREAEYEGRACAGIVVLSKEQQKLESEVKARPTTAVMHRPVGVKQLARKLEELLQAAASN